MPNAGVDAFTVATCHVTSSTTKGSTLAAAGAECVSDAGKALCTESGGTCVIERDGYYIMSSICVGLGVILLVTFILPTAKMLQGMAQRNSFASEGQKGIDSLLR